MINKIFPKINHAQLVSRGPAERSKRYFCASTKRQINGNAFRARAKTALIILVWEPDRFFAIKYSHWKIRAPEESDVVRERQKPVLTKNAYVESTTGAPHSTKE